MQRDDRFVLDDQNVRLHAVGNRRPRLFKILFYRITIGVEDGGGIVNTEPFDRNQQKCLTRTHGDAGALMVTVRKLRNRRRAEKPVEDAVEFGPRGLCGIEFLGSLEKRLERFAHGGVAHDL